MAGRVAGVTDRKEEILALEVRLADLKDAERAERRREAAASAANVLSLVDRQSARGVDLLHLDSELAADLIRNGCGVEVAFDAPEFRGRRRWPYRVTITDHTGSGVYGFGETFEAAFRDAVAGLCT